jgi:hypothetical protein
MKLKQKILVAVMGAGLTLAGVGAVSAAPLHYRSHRIERVAHHSIKHRIVAHRHIARERQARLNQNRASGHIYRDAH